jgi:Xaa-Pro aminopeptidase
VLSLLLSAAALTFQHPNPTPPADLPVAIYQERRARVLKALNGCIGVLAAQGDIAGDEGDFRQDGDFYWLTGINEPGAYLVFAPKSEYHKVTLYLRPRDPEEERWTGARDAISPDLIARYGVDGVRRGTPEGALRSAGFVHDCATVIAPPSMGKEDRNDADLAARVAQRFGLRLEYKRSLLAELREAHGAEEIDRMQRAIAITVAGHNAAAKATVAGVSERDVQTQLEYAFFAAGGTGLSYGSVVGSGPNGAVLHWDKNTRLLKDGDVVVIDAAAEYGRYAADVTRTYPVSGHFNEEQGKVYRAVYQAQQDIMAAIHPGVTMTQLQHVAEESLRHAGYLANFIHGFGHFVGLDVHDAGMYDKPLPVGAIFTVEPGVYLPDRGFGVRIEDEVLITPSGYQLLTDALPRKLEDVEAWVAKARQ